MTRRKVTTIGKKPAKKTKKAKSTAPTIQEQEPQRQALLDWGEIAPTIKLNIVDGCVIIGGDAHYIPNEPRSTAHRALLKVLRGEMDGIPRIRHLVVNGDVCDFSAASRHGRIGWEVRPLIKDEIEVCQDRMHEIEMATPRGCTRSWCVGNHDQLRFDSRLSAVAGEFFGVHGFALSDHFQNWDFSWSCEINSDIVVKHRWKGGAHAPYNNSVNSGKTIITGHRHSAKVIPYTDYSGTRYGVDNGCLADTKRRAFVNYTEGNPLNWRSGFCILTFVGGELLTPELVLVHDEEKGLVNFRGKIVKV